MSDIYNNAIGETPKASNDWLNLKQKERFSLLSNTLDKKKDFGEILELVFANDSGEITFRFKRETSPSERGSILLDLEFFLKKEIYEFLYVSIEPIGDKNSLRRLRGIDIIKGVDES